MRVLASTLSLALLLGSSRAGLAQETPQLTVERNAGAEECPDAQALTSRVERIRGRSEREHVGYRVTFSHGEDAFTAVIATPSGRSRTLESRDASCSSLANATAVSLALLFDSDPIPPPKPPPPPPKPAPPPPVVPPPPKPTTACQEPCPEPSHREANVAVGAVALAGVIAPVGLGVSAEAGIAGSRWRTSIGALWAPKRSLTLGPGVVREELLSGRVRVCYAPWQSPMLRFDVCSGAFIGLVTAEGQGFTRDDRRTRAWLAWPAEIALAGGNGRVGWEVVGGALVPVRRNDFAVDGVGIAYRSPPVGGIVSLRVVGMMPW